MRCVKCGYHCILLGDYTGKPVICSDCVKQGLCIDCGSTNTGGSKLCDNCFDAREEAGLI